MVGCIFAIGGGTPFIGGPIADKDGGGTKLLPIFDMGGISGIFEA